MWEFPWSIVGFMIVLIPFWLFYKALKSAKSRDPFYDIENHPPPGVF